MKILGDNASKEFGLHAAIPTLPEPENGSTTVEEKWDMPLSKTATRLTHMKLRFRVQRFLLWSDEMRNGFLFYIEMEV